MEFDNWWSSGDPINSKFEGAANELELAKTQVEWYESRLPLYRKPLLRSDTRNWRSSSPTVRQELQNDLHYSIFKLRNISRIVHLREQTAAARAIEINLDDLLAHERLIVDVAYDVAVGLVGSATYEAAKHLINKWRGRGRDRLAAPYTQPELEERAQRSTAIETGVDFSELTLRRTKITGRNTITASFAAPTGDRYTVDVEVVGGVSFIKSMEHELPP